jgi:hypothetical protein
MKDQHAARRTPLVLVAAALALLLPAGAAAQPEDRTFLELTLGATLPAHAWIGTTDVGGEPGDVSYGNILAPAFVGGLHFGYLFSVGSGPACCLLGPEIAYDYVVWEADTELFTHDPYYDSGGSVSGLRHRLLAAARLMGVWSWGYALMRFGLGPEIAALSGDHSSEYDGSVGGYFLFGGGLGVLAADWVAFSLLASMLIDFHDGNPGLELFSSEYDYSDDYFVYNALEFDLSVGVTFFL